MKPPGYINKKEAAALLGVKMRTIDNMIKFRRIPFYKFGHSVMLKEEEILQAVKAARVPAESEPKPAPPTAFGVDTLKAWTFVCQWLRYIQNGRDEKHARLAKDCLAHIAKFVE